MKVISLLSLVPRLVFFTVYTVRPTRGQSNCHHSGDKDDSSDSSDSDSDSDDDDDGNNKSHSACSTSTMAASRTTTKTTTTGSTTILTGSTTTFTLGTTSLPQSTSTSSGAALVDNTLNGKTRSHVSGGAVAGIIIGIILFSLFVLFLTQYFRKRYARRIDMQDKEEFTQMMEAQNRRQLTTGITIEAADINNYGGMSRQGIDEKPMPLPNPHPVSLIDDSHEYTPLSHHDSSILASVAISHTLSSPSISSASPIQSPELSGRDMLHSPQNLRESMVAHQKELESSYRMIESGVVSRYGDVPASSSYAEPPPRYND